MTHDSRSFHAFLGLSLIVFCCGIITPVGYAIISRARSNLADPLLASLLVYMSSFFLSGVMLPSPAAQLLGSRRSENDRIQLRWWMATGGFFGAGKVLMVTITAKKLPLLLLSLSFHVGSIGTAYVFDQFGLFGLKKYPITRYRFGSLVAFTAGLAFLCVDDAGEFDVSFIPHLFMACAGGASVPMQGSLNNLLQATLAYKSYALSINLAAGTFLLCLVWVVQTVIIGKWEAVGPLHWLNIFVPIIVLLLIFTSYVMPPKLGYALYLMLLIMGEMAMGVILDSTNIIKGRPQRSVEWNICCGLGLAILGTMLNFYAKSKETLRAAKEKAEDKYDTARVSNSSPRTGPESPRTAGFESPRIGLDSPRQEQAV